MPDLDLLDNDILFKVSCFDFSDGLAAYLNGSSSPSRLKVAEYVLSRKIARSSGVRDKEGAAERLKSLLTRVVSLEPNDAEVSLASEIEAAAQEQNLSFDTGESQLLAVLIVRSARRLLTGDKRAIEGLLPLCECLGKQAEVSGKIVCFEQLLLALLDLIGAEELVARVCSEPDVDKTASISCGCATGGTGADRISEGLNSYLRYLRERSGDILSA
jgi:hypothetical protein